METIYVSKRSEVTAEIDRLFNLQPATCNPKQEVYRTRINCNCTYPFNFRYGALVVTNNIVTHKIVRCKQCAKGGGL